MGPSNNSENEETHRGLDEEDTDSARYNANRSPFDDLRQCWEDILDMTTETVMDLQRVAHCGESTAELHSVDECEFESS